MFAQRQADHLQRHVSLLPQRSNLLSILSSVTPVSVPFLPTVCGLSGELRRCLFHGQGMRVQRSQTDVRSARQFQTVCYANKNGQL